MVEAAPGFGKSLFALAQARLTNARTHYLVTTKSLQYQVRDEFDDVFSMVGRNMHNCVLPGFEEYTVDKAPCTADYDCPLKKLSCPYYLAKANAETASTLVTNYQWYWYNGEHSYPKMQTPDLLICDEADSIESSIMSFGSLQITSIDCFELGMSLPTANNIDEWSTSAKDKIDDKIRQLQEDRKTFWGGVSTVDNPASMAIAYEISKFQELLGRILSIKNGWQLNRALYVVDSSPGLFQIRPIVATLDAERLIHSRSPKKIFMSATLMGKEGFCKELAIPVDEAEYIEVDASFPAENRALILHNRAQVNNKTIDILLPDIVRWLDDLIDAYMGKKGIVHTTNYKIQQYILAHSAYKSDMIGHNRNNRQTAIKHFKHKKAMSIIVSPSLVRGEDFPGYHCEWQALIKAPYPNIADVQVKARMAIDPGWVERVTLRNLIQAYGRGTRKETDVCDTHVYDSNVDTLLLRAQKIVPNYLWEAISRKTKT